MAGPNSIRRKLAIASWGRPRDPSIFGKLTVDVTEALVYLRHIRETTGEQVTITHLVGKAVAAALEAEPSLNGTIRLGRFVPRDDVSVAFLVQVDEGAELTNATIADVDEKPVGEIARELRERARALRRGEDDDWQRSRTIIRWLPTQLLRPVLWLVGLLSGSFGWSLPELGIRRYPFGSAIVTSVGMFGLDEAFIPPTPFARVPLYVLIGAIREAPAVGTDGGVTVRKELTITATLDHRFVDGFQAGVLARTFRRVIENPWELEGAAGRPKRVAGAASTV